MNINYKLKDLNKVLPVVNELEGKGIDPTISKLYALRGINGWDDANLIQALEPWKNMMGIEKAAEILSNAIINKDRICIVADYDTDGATSCAIGVLGLKMFGADIDFMVPNRFVHGYGLTPSVVDEVYQNKKPKLIVTVDNGTSSFDGVIRAYDLGMKVLVTDHHLAAATLPDVECIVNPNQPNCPFKSKSIAGCGVIFYVLCALRQRMINIGQYTKETVPNVFSLLDLVAVGTIADVVKLDLNNRILVHHGLKLIHKAQTRAGIIALAEISKKNHRTLSTTDIGFGLGPRLNAAGRLEDMSIGIQCLLTNNIEKAKELAKKLDSINVKRKSIENDMKEKALVFPDIDKYEFSKVVYDESFHEGVIGIVASRIKEKYYRPTIVMAPSDEEEYIKGSARSIPEIHMRDALDYVHKKDSSIMVKFGGHSMAAGLTLKKEAFPKFQALFDEAIQYFSTGKELLNVKEIDMELGSNYLNLDFAKKLRNEIWGQGFLQPLFCSEFNILEQVLLKDEHLKLTLEKDGETFIGMWFFKKELLDINSIKLVYTISINEFLGNESLQLLIDGSVE